MEMWQRQLLLQATPDVLNPAKEAYEAFGFADGHASWSEVQDEIFSLGLERILEVSFSANEKHNWTTLRNSMIQTYEEKVGEKCELSGAIAYCVAGEVISSKLECYDPEIAESERIIRNLESTIDAVRSQPIKRGKKKKILDREHKKLKRENQKMGELIATKYQTKNRIEFLQLACIRKMMSKTGSDYTTRRLAEMGVEKARALMEYVRPMDSTISMYLDMVSWAAKKQESATKSWEYIQEEGQHLEPVYADARLVLRSAHYHITYALAKLRAEGTTEPDILERIVKEFDILTNAFSRAARKEYSKFKPNKINKYAHVMKHLAEDAGLLTQRVAELQEGGEQYNARLEHVYGEFLDAANALYDRGFIPSREAGWLSNNPFSANRLVPN